MKDTFEKNSFMTEDCLINIRVIVKVFTQSSEIRIISLPTKLKNIKSPSSTLLKSVFLQVLGKDKKRFKNDNFLSAFSMIKGFIDNRFEVIKLIIKYYT